MNNPTRSTYRPTGYILIIFGLFWYELPLVFVALILSVITWGVAFSTEPMNATIIAFITLTLFILFLVHSLRSRLKHGHARYVLYLPLQFAETTFGLSILASIVNLVIVNLISLVSTGTFEFVWWYIFLGPLFFFLLLSLPVFIFLIIHFVYDISIYRR